MPFLLWHYLTESAGRHGERPAVIWRDETITYRELDERSTRLATWLADRGIGPGSVVGLFLTKSSASVVAMLGVSKTGATYVPVDPNMPVRRASFILADCEINGLVTDVRHLRQLGDLSDELPSLKAVVLANGSADLFPDFPLDLLTWSRLDQVTPREPDPAVAVESDPAFLLYTSGSTGNPKGVTISHRNAMTFVDWGATAFGVTEEDRLSNHAPMHFDLSVFDIYVALRQGACVIPVPDQVAPFPVELATWIDEQRISVWYSVPSALVRLLLHGQLASREYKNLRTVLYAGEAFPVKHLREVMKCFPHARFHNLYGPTETNVCTYYSLPAELPADVTDVSIGKACENTFCFVVDDEGRAVGPGGTGELYVRGPSVMLGYWRRQEKTREAMITNPLRDTFPETAYRTGDLVRVEADGNYTFLGRRDHMVKSRGYRIELGEIESALHQHDLIQEAVVVPVPDEEIGARLVAVVVAAEGDSLDAAELEKFCLGRVPKYMVPETFQFRETLPRTSTGKADRVSLAEEFNHNQ